MVLSLFNTYGRKIQEFKPQQDNQVKMYTCGPTVYNFAHIGNLRTYVFEDILKRVLLHKGYNVLHIMNITDVGHLTSDADEGEDKMEKGAKREGKSVYEIAKFYEKKFFDDCEKLNLIRPSIVCRATEHIQEQIDLIKILEQKGYTYRTSDGIYYDTSKFKNYGKLALLNKEGLKEGARIGINSEKRNPTDFALWKFSPKDKKRAMEWDSPWGVGFPGWHIECSAMALKYGGPTLDIHCGGVDHIPVHHTNEIAQSEAATGKRFSNWWMHGEFLVLDSGDKMAKSDENFLTLQKVIDMGFSPKEIRYFLLHGHYRQKLKFSKQSLDSAKNSVKNLQDTIDMLLQFGAKDSEPLPQIKQFFDALDNDLNMPEALKIVFEVNKLVKNSLPADEEFRSKALAFFKQVNSIIAVLDFDNNIPDKALLLLKQREEARKNKDWQTADKIRDKIKQLGFTIEDSKQGPYLKRI